MKALFLPWRNLPQEAKLLLAALLLVSVVAIWYGGLYLPVQMPVEVRPAPGQFQGPRQGEEAPRVIEVPPTPRVIEVPPTPSFAQAALQGQGTYPSQEAREEPVSALTLSIPKAQEEALPLLESQRTLSASEELISTLQVETPRPQVEDLPLLTPPVRLVEVPLPKTPQAPEGGETESFSTFSPKTSLQALVEEKGIKLAGTLLGPVSAAILETKEGYWVLPVGSLLPDSEVVLRRIESNRVVLVLKGESLEITSEEAQGGGNP